MKERPILFSGAMVRAILSGAKTQTRRLLKPQPQMVTDRSIAPWRGDATNLQRLLSASGRACPYGQPGDRLWVKETWRPRISHACAMDACDCADVAVDYVADGAGRWFSEEQIAPDWLMPKAAARGNVSPLFMPRWASRITLEITSVRVERLQAISEADALVEGINCYPFVPDDGFPVCDGYTYKQDDGKCGLWPRASQAFRELWESINGPGSWGANPWVWVVEFRRIEA